MPVSGGRAKRHSATYPPAYFEPGGAASVCATPCDLLAYGRVARSKATLSGHPEELRPPDMPIISFLTCTFFASLRRIARMSTASLRPDPDML